MRGPILSAARVAVPVTLLAAGIVELVVTIIVVTTNPSAWTLTAMNLPSSFLPVTLAVVFATVVPGGKWLRSVIAIAAIAFAGVRLGLVVALFASRPDAGEWLLGVVSGSHTTQVSLGISVVTGSLMGLALAAWACLEWLQPVFTRTPARHTAASPGRPAAAPPTPRSTPGPVIRTHQAPTPAAQWRDSATPWPRRVEEDADGTLIRPPRSRH